MIGEQPQPKTIEDLLKATIVHGTDRGALVRKGRTDRSVAVCVLMMAGSDAWKVLGDALKTGVIDALEAKGGQKFVFVESPRELSQLTIPEFFQAIEGVSSGWAVTYGDLYAGMVRFGFMLFFGEVCTRVAEICNAHGAPCFLNGIAAPGRPGLS